VFYPWTGRLVRILPAGPWKELRSDRNRYKLTTAEQRRLAAATVVVAGLSVGASVVHVMALEGTGGRLRLADPDTLDGTNCNRLRASVWDLGQSKAVLAARMVWEIDPFCRVEVIPAAVSAANIDQFLAGADVVVEECDSFATKVLIRQEARRRRLPVVMATAERGMLDVERFDLEPDRPLFHGLAPEIESAELSSVSGDDRARLALQIIGADLVSDRAAASMIEIDRTVSSWPQLAAEVVSGGAHAAVAVRRILLRQPCPSGRHHLDIDRVLDPVSRAHRGRVTPLRPLRTDLRASAARVADANPFIEDVVTAAVHAPSAGNSQPWRFGWDGHELSVRLDRQRARAAVDPGCAAGWIALGAACENIAIAACHRGRRARFSWFPDRDDRDLAATVYFEQRRGELPSSCDRLFPLIVERCTDRTVGSADPLSSAQRRALEAAASVHGASLHIVDDRRRLARFARLIGVSDRLRFLNPTFHRELADELRWTEHDDRPVPDGVDVASLGLEPSSVSALRLLVRPSVSSFLAAHDLGRRLIEIQRRTLLTTTALALLTVSSGTPFGRLRGGRALQHVWLEATAHGLAVHPVTPLSLFGVQDDDESCLSSADRHTLCRIARELTSLFAIEDGSPILIMRLHHGSTVAPVRVGRRPIHEILHTTREAA
jgi:molybdopterin/thiamine biosynthesis adenylyltransferase